MAYLNVDAFGAAGALVSPRAARQPDRARFSPLEWLVIALAQRDGERSLRQPGRLATAMAALFGRARANPLAEPRLEALRRMAVLARVHGDDVPAAELAAFRQAGFSVEQAALLRASVAGARA